MGKLLIDQLSLIKDLLDDNFLEKDDNATFLEEKDKGISIMKRRIIANNGINYLLYKFDPNKKNLFPYFSNKSNLNKICDYILFATEGSDFYILLIELKLGTASATNQLIASECFVNFLLNSAKRVGIKLTEKIHIRKIRVSEQRSKMRNRTTKHKSLEFDENDIINYDYLETFRIKAITDI